MSAAKRTRRTRSGILLMAVSLLLLALAGFQPATAAVGDCGALKWEYPGDSGKSITLNGVTVTVTFTGGKTLTWSTVPPTPIAKMEIQAGDGSQVDITLTNLAASGSLNIAGPPYNWTHDFSHVQICLGSTTTSSTTTTTQPTTTVTQPTTTVTQPTTTVTQPTTTVTQPTTTVTQPTTTVTSPTTTTAPTTTTEPTTTTQPTTTIPDEVLPTIITKPSPAKPEAPEVLPEVVAAEELPMTGTDPAALLVAAGMLMSAGGGLLFSSRRK